ncbi:response regulator transcription factor [Nigerium sp.]|uniref:winged helix-turn-helix transcriptional regulator n=1 Tax=Nigerium sp. TaxID=2042655 RepID=UPI0032218C3F
MARLLFVSADSSSDPGVTLPALELLAHDVRVATPDATALNEAARVDGVLVDARRDLAAARMACRLFAASGSSVPLLLVLTEGGCATVTADWGMTDIVVESASPVELDARIRLLVAGSLSDGLISAGGITIDESAYHAALQGRPLDLTYTEFELLKYLVQHPGRVFSREQLLSDVWGYDYYGGTRTVDVHVRRLRAKLGPEHENLIGTVRNVGYRFTPEGTRLI